MTISQSNSIELPHNDQHHRVAAGDFNSISHTGGNSGACDCYAEGDVFEYLLTVIITHNGDRFEATKTLHHSAKFVVGDVLTVDDTHFVVDYVSWYMEKKDQAYLDLRTVEYKDGSRDELMDLVPDVFDALRPISA